MATSNQSIMHTDCVMPLFAQASCSSVTRTARNFVMDVGEECAERSGGLRKLAACSLNKPERDAHRLLVGKLGLSLPVPLKPFSKDFHNIPVLRLQDWATFLSSNNLWFLLCGLTQPNEIRQRCILAEVRRRYFTIQPSHPIYDMASEGRLSLDTKCSLAFHGDEGRGCRRSGCVQLA